MSQVRDLTFTVELGEPFMGQLPFAHQGFQHTGNPQAGPDIVVGLEFFQQGLLLNALVESDNFRHIRLQQAGGEGGSYCAFIVGLTHRLQ